jgi:hypothetical protein
MITIRVEPLGIGYSISIVGRGGAAPLKGQLPTLERVLESFQSIWIDAGTVKLAANVLKSGLPFEFPNIDLVDDDLPKLGINL